MHLQILTPDKIAFDGEVESILAPGEGGVFEILKGHAPILASLNPGNVRVIDAEKKTLNFHVSQGFLEFNRNVGVFLADAVERPGEIDVERARAAKERAEKLLENRERVDVKQVEKALMRSLSREKFHERFSG